MAKLIAKSPLADQLPLTIGDVTLTEVHERSVLSIAPYQGQDGAVSALLARAFSLGLPLPNRRISNEQATILWAGQGRALLIDAKVPRGMAEHAALTDQTGAEAVVQLSGASVGDVLARLVPIDLRDPAFATGHTARTMLGHMMASVSKTAPQTFEVRVMRSMAGTLVHDLTQAAKGVTARARL